LSRSYISRSFARLCGDMSGFPKSFRARNSNPCAMASADTLSVEIVARPRVKSILYILSPGQRLQACAKRTTGSSYFEFPFCPKDTEQVMRLCKNTEW
jgi:hypothetical protein